VPVAKLAYSAHPRGAFADLSPQDKVTRLQAVYPDLAAHIDHLMLVGWQSRERDRRQRQARASLTRRLAATGTRE